jgi:replicative DNA helicase
MKQQPATGRQPPHSVDAEEQLISACLLDNGETLAQCINRQILPSFFYVPANGIIFGVLVGMHSEGKSAELYVLAEELKTSNQMDMIGGMAYLLRVSLRTPTTAGAGYFADKVIECAALRSTIYAATELVERCYTYTGEGITEVVNPTVNRLLAITGGNSVEQEPEWAKIVEEGEKQIEAMIAQKEDDKSREIAFPWPRMNEVFGPMSRGQLVIIAARASIGKSSLARPILAHASHKGFYSYYVTLEVNPVKVPLQIAASISGVGLRRVARAHKAEQEELKDALKSLKSYGVTISRKDRSITRIESRIRALHAKGKLDIVFIDHGGYVDEIYKAKAGEKVGACGLLTKTLKTLADELGIVVVLLWQLNRNSVQSGNREPNVSDLKDSGSLEEDGDKVILIHRPDADPLQCNAKQADTMSVAELPSFFQNVIQAKGRDDGTAMLSFYLHRETATFKLATQETH